jgi:hypothetical protein
MIQAKMTVIDLNLFLNFGHSKFENPKGMANEYRENGLCSTNGLPTAARVPKVCREIPWQLQGAKLFMFGSIPVLNIRSTHLSGKSPRHRSMPASGTEETLPHGHPCTGLPKYSRGGQREQRLTYLCRFFSGTDQYCTTTLRPRRVRRGTGPV